MITSDEQYLVKIHNISCEACGFLVVKILQFIKYGCCCVFSYAGGGIYGKVGSSPIEEIPVIISYNKETWGTPIGCQVSGQCGGANIGSI